MVAHGPGELGARRHLVVSQRLRLRRRELGLTQRDVTTRLAALGVHSTNKSLSSLERGSGVDVAKLPELAAALHCSVTWLLGLTEDPHSWEPTHQLPGAPLGSAAGAVAQQAEPASPPPDSRSRAGGAAHRPWILGPLDPGQLPASRPRPAARTR